MSVSKDFIHRGWLSTNVNIIAVPALNASSGQNRPVTALEIGNRLILVTIGAFLKLFCRCSFCCTWVGWHDGDVWKVWGIDRVKKLWRIENKNYNICLPSFLVAWKDLKDSA